MTRPAVIIGLGGTGQWVTTYVKRDLLENYRGQMPHNIRLLCFDTWKDANVGDDVNHHGRVAGNVKLEPNIEFIPLCGDTFSLGLETVQGHTPHIGKRISSISEDYTWFDSRHYLNNLPRDSWLLNSGVGQIRQYGRLGFFNHATAIKANLERAFTDVANASPLQQKVQVIFIASFAGGTGGGMFLDMAVMARSLTHLLGPREVIVRGIFALPGVFSGCVGIDKIEHQRMEARAYAAWRELSRFMNLGPNYGAHQIKYDNRTTIFVNAKPFDQVFLLDASRPQYDFINTNPEKGVFPAIASFINTALDDEAGVLLDNACDYPIFHFGNQLGYSSFGAYEICSPITHIASKCTLQSSHDLLKRWLAPTFAPRDRIETITGLYPDQALEKPGMRGAQEIRPFMTQPCHQLNAVVNRAQPEVANPTRVFESLKVLPAIYNLYEAFTTGLYGNRVEEDAQGGYCAPDADQKVNTNSWLGRLLIPGDHEKTPVIGPDGHRQPVDPVMLIAEVASTVRGSVPTSRDLGRDPTIDEANRIIAAVENKQDGYIVSHYYGGPGGRGSFDEELDKLFAFNSARFKQVLEVELLNLLNGTVEDVYRGFTGRLGYVEEFLKTLFDALEWYQTEHLKAVKTRRATMQLENNAAAILDTARAEMVSNTGKKCLFFFNHPRAFNKQEDYLAAAQNYCEVRKDDKLIETLIWLLDDLRKVVRQTLVEVQAWKEVFLIGPDSLYTAFQLENAEINYELECQIQANQSKEYIIPQNDPLDNPQDPYVLWQIDEQLKHFRWTMNVGDDWFRMGCELDLDGQYVPFRKNNSDGYNHSLFIHLGRSARIGIEIDNNRKLIDEIGHPASPNYRDPNQLGQRLVAHSGPMFSGMVPGVGIKSALLQVNMHSETPGYNPQIYVAQVGAVGARMILPPLNPINGYILATSANSYKMTLIQWVDRLAETDFAVYSRLKQSYYHQLNGGYGYETGSRLHIFPAESCAAFYEQHLPQWFGKPIRELSPRVVLLMADVERVRLFFQCYALGMIVHGRDSDGLQFWRLVIRDDHSDQSMDSLFFFSNSPVEPDPFEVISGFIAGIDQKTRQLISWNLVHLAIHDVCNKTGSSELKGFIDAQFDPALGTLPKFYYPAAVCLDHPKSWVRELKDQSNAYYTQCVVMHGSSVQTNPGWVWIRHEDYQDLSDVARMMYIETLLLKKVIREEDLPGSIYQKKIVTETIRRL